MHAGVPDVQRNVEDGIVTGSGECGSCANANDCLLLGVGREDVGSGNRN